MASAGGKSGGQIRHGKTGRACGEGVDLHDPLSLAVCALAAAAKAGSKSERAGMMGIILFTCLNAWGDAFPPAIIIDSGPTQCCRHMFYEQSEIGLPDFVVIGVFIAPLIRNIVPVKFLLTPIS